VLNSLSIIFHISHHCRSTFIIFALSDCDHRSPWVRRRFLSSPEPLASARALLWCFLLFTFSSTFSLQLLTTSPLFPPGTFSLQIRVFPFFIFWISYFLPIDCIGNNNNHCNFWFSSINLSIRTYDMTKTSWIRFAMSIMLWSIHSETLETDR
jgi:hypothetical protein